MTIFLTKQLSWHSNAHNSTTTKQITLKFRPSNMKKPTGWLHYWPDEWKQIFEAVARLGYFGTSNSTKHYKIQKHSKSIIFLLVNLQLLQNALAKWLMQFLLDSDLLLLSYVLWNLRGFFLMEKCHVANLNEKDSKIPSHKSTKPVDAIFGLARYVSCLGQYSQ